MWEYYYLLHNKSLINYINYSSLKINKHWHFAIFYYKYIKKLQNANMLNRKKK